MTIFPFSELIRQILDNRSIEVDSTSASEIEDANMADDSDASSDTSKHIRSNRIRGLEHDRYRPKRKFFRSSLVWDPLTTVSQFDGYGPQQILNGWA